MRRDTMSNHPWFSSIRSAWLSRVGLEVQARTKVLRRRLRFLRADKHSGDCPVCGEFAEFAVAGGNPREDLICLQCGSVPRQRALADVVGSLGLNLGDCSVHESSPSLCCYFMWERKSRTFTGSYFFPNVAVGTRVGEFTCADLRRQPFLDGSFDVVITQDVLEHVPEPTIALAETHRTLKPGGAHVFTVPRTSEGKTKARAMLRDGKILTSEPPVYHRNPIDRSGSLVITDWGYDLERIVTEACGSECTSVVMKDARRGYPLPVEVFVVRRK